MKTLAWIIYSVSYSTLPGHSKPKEPNSITSDIFSTRPEGFQEAFETGIEYQKFARSLGMLKRFRKETDANIDISSILPEFEALCGARAEQLEHRKDSDADYMAFGLTDEYKLWQSESHTWLLLQTLASAFDHTKPPIKKGPDALAWSDLDLIEHLARTDNEFKHHSAVRLWLETIAPPFNSNAVAKTFTQQTSIGSAFSFGPRPSPIKPEYLDPDAVTRDRIKLSESNQLIEHNLLRTVWEYIRRGQLQEAKDACVKAGEPWRAESISGGEPYSVSIAFTDPQYDREEGLIGNKTRGLWKGTCYALANEASADQYERAVYGALCGDVPSVLPVCSSWEDHAWAHYNALVESMIEGRLSQFNRGGASKALPLPATKITSAKAVFDSLANSDSEELRNTSKDVFKAIQTSIILGQTDQLLAKMARDAKASSSIGAPLRPHMLRFMAHFVLLLRSRNSVVPKDDGDYFVKSYVDYLISRKMYDLAPLYASFLPLQLQIETCSSYLKTIDGAKKERQGYLVAIRQNGLDLHKILTATVDGLMDNNKAELECVGDYATNMQESIMKPISSQEKAAIKAMEWLTFDEAPYDECLHRSNYLTRRYLLQGRLYAAFSLFNALPSDIVKDDLDEAPPFLLTVSHEHLYYRDLFNARLLFEEWRDAIRSKPVEEASRSRMHAWELDVKNRAQKAIVEIESLLQSRWLFDCILAGDTTRNQELRRLRQIYVSELVMNLHKIYYDSRVVIPEYLEKSVDMSNLVASEAAGVPLYKELQESNRLAEFLDHVRLSSLELVREGRSPFAF
ncbi:nuclear pore protein 84/107 [Gamsiella multidivaricata]|uniref:nuclear pore protein 84/107 n=1 Tax=Gamsiella multidivaricata TaxID=101098 RepID=UPI00221E6A40|nr:nuclear pore protein 84/107 [Gamsiella multidivaricata]KAI7828810.1 nuclear pore protein 84/107 [Gamsiella multidivaricata]